LQSIAHGTRAPCGFSTIKRRSEYVTQGVHTRTFAKKFQLFRDEAPFQTSENTAKFSPETNTSKMLGGRLGVNATFVWIPGAASALPPDPAVGNE
jgi:hypothetical protein